MATAIVAGLDYTSPVTEFNVRPQPGTVPNEVVFKAAKGTANCEILDVQPDNQNTKQQDGQIYQWFQLRFPDGQVGWLRSHVLTIEGDLTAFGYGTLSVATYAYRLTRVIPTAPATAPAPASPAPTVDSEVTSAPSPAPASAPEPTAPSMDSEVSVTPSPGPVPMTSRPSSAAALSRDGCLCRDRHRGARRTPAPKSGGWRINLDSAL